MEHGFQVTSAAGWRGRVATTAAVTRIQVRLWLGMLGRSCRRNPINWTRQRPGLCWTPSLKLANIGAGAFWPPMFERLTYMSLQIVSAILTAQSPISRAIPVGHLINTNLKRLTASDGRV